MISSVMYNPETDAIVILTHTQKKTTVTIDGFSYIATNFFAWWNYLRDFKKIGDFS